MVKEFTHLHCHSSYSIMDGITSTEVLAQHAKEQGHTALALTDHGNMHGYIEFYEACKKAEIKPILGCEFYCARNSALEKRDNATNPTDHFLVLARNMEGYQNLLQLATRSYNEGFHYVPRIDKRMLSEHSEGLIATSACLSGAVARIGLGHTYSVREGNRWIQMHQDASIDAAIAYAKEFQDILGKDGFFLEIQDHNVVCDLGLNEERTADCQDMVKRQTGVVNLAYDIARKAGIHVVATNDVHYAKREHWIPKDTIFAIRTGKLVDDPARKLCTNSDQGYLKTPEEMCELFKDYPDAIKNTQWIAEQCNVEIPMGENHIPQYETDGIEISTYFRDTVLEGFRERYPAGTDQKAAQERLDHEIKVIENMDFVSYFLMVADFVDFARSNSIPVGPGRGSAAGSIVSYCLGITDLCPLEHGLLFERFLNSERVSLPDIDLDFCKERIGEVYTYAKDKYGEENVARIATFGSLWPRALMRRLGKAHGIPQDEIGIVAKSIPEGGGEFRIKMSSLLDENELVKTKYENDPLWKKVIDESAVLEGTKVNVSKHAAGIVIGDSPLTNYIPLMKPTVKKVSASKKGMYEDTEIDALDTIPLTQVPMDHLEELGLIKMDFLALETLTVMQRCLDLINEHSKEPVVLPKKLNDEATYELLRSGQLLGVFQVESTGLRDLLIKIVPESFEDIVAAISLYRPGPMDYIDEETGLTMVDTYVQNRKAAAKGNQPTSELGLEETYGIIVYQEQIMKIVRDVCGYSMNDADRFRKAVGKKLPELVEREREGFTKQAIAHGKLTEEQADNLFETIAAFARYGFNKSHAAAYGMITYQTAWLKAHYPREFMCALLTSAGRKSDVGDRRKYIEEATMIGLTILAPDINNSQKDFVPTTRDKTIQAGLVAVKGLDKAADLILEERAKGGQFVGLEKTVERLQMAGCNKGSFQSLIMSGAMDAVRDPGMSRTGLFDVVCQLLPKIVNRNKFKNDYTTIIDVEEPYTFSTEGIETGNEAYEDADAVNYLGVHCRREA